MLTSVVDAAIVVSSSSSDEEAPENDDVIITSDTDDEKGMCDSFFANNAIALCELDKSHSLSKNRLFVL